MHTLKSIIFLLMISLTAVACSGPVEEAKEVNEDRFENTAMADEARFAVDFANYFLFTDTLSHVVAERTSDQLLKDFATTVRNDHQELYAQLRAIADTARIELPQQFTSEYRSFLEDIAQEDDLLEMRENYLEFMVGLHETFGKKADEKIASTEFSRFLDFARNVSSQQYVHINQAKRLLGEQAANS